MTTPSSFYRVRPGDTLSEIASRYRTTVDDLCRINGIKDPDMIATGQVISVTARAVCKVRIVLIDWDRNPIVDAKVRLEYCGRTKVATSKRNGSVPVILTEKPEDEVVISIMRPDASWEKIAKVRSGWGNKLVTLKSPKLKVTSQTSPHLQGQTSSDQPLLQLDSGPSMTPKATTARGKIEANFGDGKGLKSLHKADKDGFPSVRVTNDQAELDFLIGYTGERISEQDYLTAAQKIGCEVAAIKAVADVESRGEAFDRYHRPIILYERHVFARCTEPKGKFDKENCDISAFRHPYKRADKLHIQLVKDGKLPSYDLYGNSYSRLAKAYSLDKVAALKACSWGKFQILGENHAVAGYKTVNSFVQAMCRCEKEHLEAFVNFVLNSKKLKAAIILKAWEKFAFYYNGPKYWQNRYGIKILEAYAKYAK